MKQLFKNMSFFKEHTILGTIKLNHTHSKDIRKYTRVHVIQLIQEIDKKMKNLWMPIIIMVHHWCTRTTKF